MSSVTVVIPAYKSAAFLAETVRSALAQTDAPEAIIVVDDGSPDNSFEIAKALAAEHPTVRAVQRRNGGAAAARNTGLGAATTEYVMFLDADDRLLPEAMERLLGAFAEHPGAAMVFGSNYGIDWRGDRLYDNLQELHNVSLADLAMYVTPCPSQCLYRRDSLMAVGGLNEALRPGDEIDLNMRLLSHGEIWSFPGYVMEYRNHENQGTRNYSNSAFHLHVLSLNFGPKGRTPDPVLYRRARRKWLARYGHRQHLALLGAVRHGRWNEVVPSAKLMVQGVAARMLGAE